MHLRLKVILHCIAGEEYILKIYIWQLSNWGHLRQFRICFLKICWLSQFLLKECAWEWTDMHLRWRILSGVLLMRSRFWKYTFGNSQIEVICVKLKSVFLKICWHSQFLLKVCMGVDKYAFEVEGCSPLYCWWGVHFENIHLATLKLRSFASIWNLFFKNMLTQPIFAQRVCMGVDKYAFEVEGCCLVYCWWGVDFENIHLATLKLRSFASIWNLFFKNMLTQQIFAQRVCMGVDKYAFEVEGCSPLYCWWGVDFENIHLATLKLRSFASIWNLFFKNMLTQPIFAQRVCMGVDKYAFEVEGCSHCWLDFENIHLATLKLRSFASIWNLFFKNMLTQPIFAQRVCMGVDKHAFGIAGCCLVYCWWGVDFENMHLTTLKLRSFASIWNQFFKKYADSANFCSKGVHGSRQICIWGWRLFSTVLLMRSRFWKYTFGNSQIEVICVNLKSVF